MQQLSLTDERDLVLKILDRSPLFHGLESAHLDEVIEEAEVWRYPPKALIARQDDPSDAFYLILKGEADVVREQPGQPNVSLATLKPAESVGEMGLLLSDTRSASVFARTEVTMLKFSSRRFHRMLLRLPYFGLVMCRTLAQRLQEVNARLPTTLIHDPATPPPPEVLRALPLDFQIRHRLVPLRESNGVMTLGCVEGLSFKVLSAVQRQLPGLMVDTQQISKGFFERVMSGLSGGEALSDAPPAEEAPRAPLLDGLLRRALAEGASDIHLSARQRPFWRIHGEVRALKDLRALSSQDVMQIIEPILPEHSRAALSERRAARFTYTLGEIARFRIQLFEDLNGACASIRCIPARVPSPAELGLSPAVIDLCASPRGLILVAGPNRAGKSTTLAALVEHINLTRPVHIITLDESVEYLIPSQQALVNQREIGRHAPSFTEGIEAALREDPDVLVIGEISDFETLMMALRGASRGILVLASMNTSTTLSTLDHVFSLTPEPQRAEIRHLLANVTLALINQRLLQGIERPTRVFEVLLGTPSVLKQLRAGRLEAILPLMTSEEGHQRLDDALTRLVLAGAVEYEEALRQALAPADFAARFDRRLDD
ncbi:Flp pilus assembly complex ATPase component TadA [Myxococcota bacterium]|nr:Flp pilus assembly complex ATPase component TadA [Myxococcota bacterium]MBU1431125.1 Flp pilus assembly complex ATPase component TadA [Myxococcota bacterium]MBU1899560.1 Flp pilus assembly complex ATPase component TadA [Myxococcota bacterium]